MEYLMTEDECAPDSRKYFNKKLKENYGLSIIDFKTQGKKLVDEDKIAYKLKGFVLESFASEPYWHLRKE